MINILTWNRVNNFDLLVCKIIRNILFLSLTLAPTHAILAFKRALVELEEEGGVQGRAKR
jgi:hypothetical protein